MRLVSIHSIPGLLGEHYLFTSRLKLNTNSLLTPNTTDKLCLFLKDENTECVLLGKKPKKIPKTILATSLN